MTKILKRLSLTLVFTIIIGTFCAASIFAEQPENAAKIGDIQYPTLKAAIESAKDGDIIEPADANVTLTSGVDAALTASVTVKGFTFGDGGYLKVTGNHDFCMNDCVFAAQKPFTATGAAIPASLAVSGKLTVTGNDFTKAADGAYYNCVESGYGGQYRLKNGSEVSNNKFGNITGSAVSIFAAEDNASIAISCNSFGSCASPVLLGNMRYEKVAAVFDLKNNTKTAEAGFVTLNDNGTDKHEIFTGYTLKITNLICGAFKTAATGNEPHQYIVNSRGVLNPPDNMPTVTFETVPEPSASAEAPSPSASASEAPAVTPEGGSSTEPGAAPSDEPTAEPANEPTADPTLEPAPETTPEATAEPEASAEPSTEPTAAPEISAEPSAEPSPSSPPEASTTPAPQHTVTISAPEEVTTVTLISAAEPEITIELMRDEADGAFKGSAPDGLYEIGAKTAEGKEIDLKNSDLTLTIHGADATAKVVVTDKSEIAGISIIDPPEKTTYAAGEKFDPTGLVIGVKSAAEDVETTNAAYDENSASEFTFVPSLDTELPRLTPYDTGRKITVIYKNRAASLLLDFVMNSVSAEVTEPDVDTVASSAATVPENAYYTAGEAVWTPTIYPGSNYNYGTNYTVTVTLTAKDGFTFAHTEENPAEALINGKTAAVTALGDNGKTITITYTFPKTYLPGGTFHNSGFSTGNETPRPSTKPSLNTYDHFAYIVGYPDGRIRPENNITRDEVATIFFRLLTDDTRGIYWSQVNHYIDVPQDLWSNNAISTLTNAGILGGDGTAYFRPEDYITRAEFATIAARFSDAVSSGSGKFRDVNGHWSEEYVEIAAEEGWIQGYEDGTFKPDQNITRAEAMTIVNNVLGRKVHASGLLPGMTSWSDNRDTSEWYYAAVQEAANTHNYRRDRNSEYETWTEVGDNPDWVKLEQSWSSSGSAGDIN